ncbi:hypothetical protein [Nocardia sp. CDC160]|uniref:hypothetical protein n=1 Tax=Nocardia sp. CDC160 TaxID=3112166 RepID=UPI002DB86716|nr:hypothetical protein [Nocardia sp. CDC160]MEC3918487.1 hypothetical protein [Nocardia sp. CDC160]
MTITASNLRRGTGWFFGGIAAILWVYPVGAYLLILSALSSADTRCDVESNLHPRLNPGGIPWVIGSGLFWAAPFVVLALVRRNRLTLALAGIASAISIAFMAVFLLHPQQGFCW